MKIWIENCAGGSYLHFKEPYSVGGVWESSKGHPGQGLRLCSEVQKALRKIGIKQPKEGKLAEYEIKAKHVTDWDATCRKTT